MCWIFRLTIGQTGERKTFLVMMTLEVISATSLGICTSLVASRMVSSVMSFSMLTFLIKVTRYCRKIVETQSLMTSDHVRDQVQEWFVMNKRSSFTFLVAWRVTIKLWMTCGSSTSEKSYGAKSISLGKFLNRELAIRWIFTKVISLCLVGSLK